MIDLTLALQQALVFWAVPAGLLLLALIIGWAFQAVSDRRTDKRMKRYLEGRNTK